MDKVALVTAGSQGIGAACARRLAKDGFKVAVLSRSSKAKDVADEIEGIDSYPADNEVIAMIPAHPQAKTSEVAGIVSFLASEEASYINGENIKIDGGLSRGF